MQDLDTFKDHLLERLDQLEEDSAERLAGLADSLLDRDDTSWTSRLLWLGVGAAAGAAATLLLDPQQGQRRQQELVDRGRSVASGARATVEDTAEHATNVVEGGVAEVSDAMTGEDEPEDAQQLRQRIRSETLGTIDGADGIVVLVQQDGRVELRGQVDSEETRDRVAREVGDVDGVAEVVTEQLTVSA